MKEEQLYNLNIDQEGDSGGKALRSLEVNQNITAEIFTPSFRSV